MMSFGVSAIGTLITNGHCTMKVFLMQKLLPDIKELLYYFTLCTC